METFNALLLICLSLYYLMAPVSTIARRGFSFDAGLQFGVLYFLLVPLWVVAVNGVLVTPVDFSGTYISDLHWNQSETICILLLPMISLAIMFVWKSKLTLGSGDQQVSKGMSVGHSFYRNCLISYVAVAIAVFFLAGMADGGHWYRSKEEFLRDYGLVGALLQYSIFSVRILFLAGIVSAFCAQEVSLRRLVLLVALVCVIDLYTTGNRIFTLQAAMTIFAALIITRRVKTLMVGSLFLVPFGLLMGLFRWVRAYMHDHSGNGLSGMIEGMYLGMEFALAQIAKHGYGFLEFISGSTESVNLNVYAEIVSKFPDSYSFLYGESLLKAFVFWVPRSIWPDKPDSISVILGNLLSPGSGVSLVTTIFGEIFANFGLWFVVLVPLVVMAGNVVCDRMFGRSVLGGVVGFVIAFTLVRMPYSDVLISVLVMAAYATLFGLINRVTLAIPVEVVR